MLLTLQTIGRISSRGDATILVVATYQGERYLVSAANMTLETFLGRVARLAQVPAPRAAAAPKTMRAVGRLVEALFTRVGRTPPIDLQSIEMAEHTWYVDASKARKALGWQPRDPADTLADTVRFVQRRHNLGGTANRETHG
jgi:dihydroflavonol-4-reductase